MAVRATTNIITRNKWWTQRDALHGLKKIKISRSTRSTTLRRKWINESKTGSTYRWNRRYIITVTTSCRKRVKPWRLFFNVAFNIGSWRWWSRCEGETSPCLVPTATSVLSWIGRSGGFSPWMNREIEGSCVWGLSCVEWMRSGVAPDDELWVLCWDEEWLQRSWMRLNEELRKVLLHNTLHRVERNNASEKCLVDKMTEKCGHTS